MSRAHILVRAGQVYAAKAKRGHRFVRVEAVHQRDHVPWATLLEVGPDGAPRTGRCRSGFLFSQPFAAYCTFRDGKWTLCDHYRLEIES